MAGRISLAKVQPALLLTRSHLPLSSLHSSSKRASSFSTATANTLNHQDVSSRPFRSMLYVPASNTRALNKLSTLTSTMKPDVVMFDLEDGVGPDSKKMARDNLQHFFNQENMKMGQQKYFRIVRVNRMDTPWFGDDVAAVLKMAGNKEDLLVNGVALPKIERWEDVDFVSKHFQSVWEDISSNAPHSSISTTSDKTIHDTNATAMPPTIAPIPFWAMMETPHAILSASSIASHPSVQGLILGTNDLSKELQLRPHSNSATRGGLSTSIQTTILAARAYNKLVIDGVYNHFRDEEGFRQECTQGKEWGMDGKTLIHPNQISVTNQVFAPSEDEIEYARRVVDCWNQAKESSSSSSSSSNGRFTGVAVLDGALIEELHVDSSRKLLERAERIMLIEKE